MDSFLYKAFLSFHSEMKGHVSSPAQWNTTSQMAYRPGLNSPSKYIIDHIDTIEHSHMDGSLCDRNVKAFAFEKYNWAPSRPRSGTDSRWLLQKHQNAPQFALLTDHHLITTLLYVLILNNALRSHLIFTVTVSKLFFPAQDVSIIRYAILLLTGELIS